MLFSELGDALASARPQIPADWIALALAAFFAFAGVANLLGPAPLLQGYERWRYPRGWHLVIGGLELVAGLAILLPASRSAGMALACVIAVAALGTLHRHREWHHMPPAIILLALMATWSAL